MVIIFSLLFQTSEKWELCVFPTLFLDAKPIYGEENISGIITTFVQKVGTFSLYILQNGMNTKLFNWEFHKGGFYLHLLLFPFHSHQIS